MPRPVLKSLRVAVSLAFFAATAIAFLDFAGVLPVSGVDAALYFQFTPALVRFLAEPGWVAAGFLFVLVLTLLYGRVYCSSICPLGTLQDILNRLGGRLRRRQARVRFRYAKPRNALRFGLLLLAVLSTLGGSFLVVGLLDPFAHFGRIMALVVRPVVAGLNNLAVPWLESGDLYLLAPVEADLADWSPIVLASALLVLVGFMAVRKGRLFCNTLCPLGALLALLSRFACFRIVIDRASCNQCARCSLECKAGCIHLKTRQVDFSRCVVCFNCMPACPESGIGYRRVWRFGQGGAERARDRRCVQERSDNKLPAGSHLAERRRFLRQGIAWLAGLGVAALPTRAREWPQNLVPTTVPVEKRHPVAPPGAGDFRRLQASCIACQLCVSVCPSEVLQPALWQYGAKGVLQPCLNFRIGYCTYECKRCGDVCPTGSIQGMPLEAKKRVKIGEVHFIEDNCIVVTEKTACGACAEHCPTKAVHMVAYEPELTVPELATAICIGCGACEHACPVQPYKAIYVDGEPLHRQAEAPRSDALEWEGQDDFPF